MSRQRYSTASLREFHGQSGNGHLLFDAMMKLAWLNWHTRQQLRAQHFSRKREKAVCAVEFLKMMAA